MKSLTTNQLNQIVPNHLPAIDRGVAEARFVIPAYPPPWTENDPLNCALAWSNDGREWEASVNFVGPFGV